jgi:hypothetical protein
MLDVFASMLSVKNTKDIRRQKRFIRKEDGVKIRTGTKNVL